MPIEQIPENPVESPAPMGAFSTILDSLMREDEANQSELAAATGVDQSQISRYLRENALPDAEKLEKLCAHFGDRAGHLLVGYIRDRVPHHLLHLVNITPTGESHVVREDPSAIFSRLPRRSLNIVEAIARECENSPEVVDVLETLLAAFRRK